MRNAVFLIYLYYNLANKTFWEMYTTKQKFLYKTSKLVNFLLPQTRTWDKVYAFILFLIRHRRTPTKKMIFNDVLYRMKTSIEILDPLRVLTTDKEYLKLYVRAVVGDQHNVPTLGIIRNKTEVKDYRFPINCCMKPTHACHAVSFRTNNGYVDIKLLEGWFSLNSYKTDREANYKFLTPKIIIEPLVFQSPDIKDYNGVIDYRIFCFNGVPKLILADIDRIGYNKRKCFDPQWNEVSFSIKVPQSDIEIKKPKNLSEMLVVAANLSKPFSFVRIDLYSDGSRVLVGEITHCAGNASSIFVPRESEYEASRLIFN